MYLKIIETMLMMMIMMMIVIYWLNQCYFIDHSLYMRNRCINGYVCMYVYICIHISKIIVRISYPGYQ